MKYDEIIDGHHVQLSEAGVLLIDGKIEEWFKDTKTGKPWIPAKRKSFIGLIKQHLRD
jgi:hypothetical protein